MDLTAMRQKLRSYILVSGIILSTIIPVLQVMPARGDTAACGTLASDKGQAKQTVHIAESATYTLWLRIFAPSADANSVYAQVDTHCVVVSANRQTNGFEWIGYREGDTNKKLEFALTAGDHDVIIAGREVGVGVDKAMFVNGACQPEGLGDNCLASTTAPVPTSASLQQTQRSAQAAQPASTGHTVRWWVIAIGTAVTLAAAGLLIRRYIVCMRHHDVLAYAPAQPGILQKLQLFAKHHKVFVAVCITVVVAACVGSAVFAAEAKPVFEAEAATLSGGVKIMENGAASGGKYIQFQANGTAGTVGGSQPAGGTANTGGTSGTTQNGGASSGGGGTTGATGNPYPDRYSVGAPGVGHYAQTDATLPVPAGYTEYFPSDNSSKAYNMYSCSGTTNIDKAYFHAFIYIGTGCHGTINITNSIIAPPPGSIQRAILVNADSSASLTINVTDTTIRPEPVPLGGTNAALTDHVLNDCNTCTIHMNRVDVANAGGMCLCGQDTIVEHSWLHDSYIAHLADPGLAHTGGVFPYGGSGPLLVQYNRLEPGVNAATGAEVTNYWKAITAVLFTQGTGGSVLRNYEVHHNFISLGGYDMALENGENLSIHDNVFGPSHYDYIGTCSNGCAVSIGTWANNVIGDISGKPTTTVLARPF